MFKDVPHVDMEMHLPEQGTKVRMRWIDKAQIASPIVMGIPTLVVKLLAAAALSPMALGGLIVAPISAGVNSFFGFQRAKQKHLMTMIHQLYYLTLANNASVLTRLIDSAEDEEYKEAMLAYFFLWRAAGDGRALERRPARRPHRALPDREDRRLDQLRGRRRPDQAPPPRPRPPRLRGACSTPPRSTRPSRPSTAAGTTPSGTPDRSELPSRDSGIRRPRRAQYVERAGPNPRGGRDEGWPTT